MLDLLKSLSYYGMTVVGALATAACTPTLRSIAPSGLEPIAGAGVETWLAPYRISGPVRYDLKWRFINQKGSTAGRAAVRIAPPDTLRFDYRGPFGRSGAALIVGDSAMWVVPARETRDLIPAAPLFWAALGAPQAPPAHASVFGRERESLHAWRYVVEADTMEFVEVGPGVEHLLTEVRREGRIVASLETRFRPGTRVPTETRMRFPQDGSALIFTVEGLQTVAAFDPSTWRRP